MRPITSKLWGKEKKNEGLRWLHFRKGIGEKDCRMDRIGYDFRGELRAKRVYFGKWGKGGKRLEDGKS